MNILTGALETALDEFFAATPGAAAQLADMQGRVIEIEISSVGARLFFRPRGDGVQVCTRRPGEVDVRIAGDAFDLYQLATDSGRRVGVEISGDVELGRRFAAMFADADGALFRALARIIGDAPAHWTQRRVDEAVRVGGRCLDALIASAGDYLREEARMTPDPDEIRSFVKQVDELRDACARFEARLRRHAGRGGAQ